MDVQASKQAAKLFKKTIWNPKTPIKTSRKLYDDLLGNHLLPNNVDLHEVDIGPVFADLLSPELAFEKRIILYAHGGNFISGSRFSARSLCASIAHESASRLLVPEYRLAPEFPFPTAIEDLYHAYAWLLKQGYPAKQILFAGDGAGGNLALALTHNLLGRNLPLPAALVLLSPWTDLSCEQIGNSANKNLDLINSKETLVNIAHQYTYASNFTNPQASPCFADYSHFPPVYIQCGSQEILLEDAKYLKRKLEAAQTQVILDVEEGMWHLFQAIDSLTPKAHKAVQRIGQWIRRVEL